MSDKGAKPVCGIVMPISACDGCSDLHWIDVKKIISSSIVEAGLQANLVSEADEVGVIHRTIIQNLYDNPIVVCDVSGKNPNVMFELGLRLAFDKATIIIKDDKTDYSFDTSVIEHVTYPRDLRHNIVEDFKNKLADKIKSTYSKSIEDKQYSTFLKHFHQIKASKLGQTEVSEQQFVLEELKRLGQSMQELKIINHRNYELENTVLPGSNFQRTFNQMNNDNNQSANQRLREAAREAAMAVARERALRNINIRNSSDDPKTKIDESIGKWE
jgi:hypothetical protein